MRLYPLDENFTVGTRIQLSTQPDTGTMAHFSSLVGFAEGEFLMVKCLTVCNTSIHSSSKANTFSYMHSQVNNRHLRFDRDTYFEYNASLPKLQSARV